MHEAPAGPTLEQLESDLAAVESAMATLDRIAAEGPGGDASAAEMAAVVSPARFPLAGDSAPRVAGPVDHPGPAST